MKWADYYEHYDDWQSSTQYSRLASITDWGANTSPSSEIADCVLYVDERTAKVIFRKALDAGVKFSPNEIIEIMEYGVTDDPAIIKHLLSSVNGEFTEEQFVTILNHIVNDEVEAEVVKQICTKTRQFTEKEILEMVDILCTREDLVDQLLRKTDTIFSEEGLNELCDYGIDEGIVKKISERSGIPYQNPDEAFEDDFDGESEEDYITAIKKGLQELQNIDVSEINVQSKKASFWSTLLAALVTDTASCLGNDAPAKRVSFSSGCTGDCAHCPPHYGYRYGRWYYGHGHEWGCEFCGNGGCSGR